MHPIEVMRDQLQLGVGSRWGRDREVHHHAASPEADNRNIGWSERHTCRENIEHDLLETLLKFCPCSTAHFKIAD